MKKDKNNFKCLQKAIDYGLIKRYSEKPIVGFCIGVSTTTQDCKGYFTNKKCLKCMYYVDNFDPYNAKIVIGDSYIPSIDGREHPKNEVTPIPYKGQISTITKINSEGCQNTN